VKSVAASGVEQVTEKYFADSLSGAVTPYIDGVLNRGVVGGSVLVRGEGSPADDLAGF
jgi:hypothetical protein